MRVGSITGKLEAHLEMMRPYTLFHPGMLGLASALYLSRGEAEPWRLALAFVVPTLGWLAGLYAGDYFDRRLDAAAKPHRPVPSGRVREREAFAFMVAYIAVGYTLSSFLGWLALAVAVLTTVFGIAYSKTFKRHAIMGNLDRGALAVFTVIFAWTAVGEPAGEWSALLLVGVFFFHDSTTNLVGAIRDTDGDREAGYETVPVVYGIHHAVYITVFLAAASLMCGTALFTVFVHRPVAVGMFAISVGMLALALVALYAARYGMSRRRALAAHKVLVIERLILSAAVGVAYGPLLLMLALLGATVAATLLSQALLRNRYEFKPGEVGG